MSPSLPNKQSDVRFLIYVDYSQFFPVKSMMESELLKRCTAYVCAGGDQQGVQAKPVSVSATDVAFSGPVLHTARVSMNVGVPQSSASGCGSGSWFNWYVRVQYYSPRAPHTEAIHKVLLTSSLQPHFHQECSTLAVGHSALLCPDVSTILDYFLFKAGVSVDVSVAMCCNIVDQWAVVQHSSTSQTEKLQRWIRVLQLKVSAVTNGGESWDTFRVRLFSIAFRCCLFKHVLCSSISQQDPHFWITELSSLRQDLVLFVQCKTRLQGGPLHEFSSVPAVRDCVTWVVQENLIRRELQVPGCDLFPLLFLLNEFVLCSPRIECSTDLADLVAKKDWDQLSHADREQLFNHCLNTVFTISQGSALSGSELKENGLLWLHCRDQVPLGCHLSLVKLMFDLCPRSHAAVLSLCQSLCRMDDVIGEAMWRERFPTELLLLVRQSKSCLSADQESLLQLEELLAILHSNAAASVQLVAEFDKLLSEEFTVVTIGAIGADATGGLLLSLFPQLRELATRFCSWFRPFSARLLQYSISSPQCERFILAIREVESIDTKQWLKYLDLTLCSASVSTTQASSETAWLILSQWLCVYLEYLTRLSAEISNASHSPPRSANNGSASMAGHVAVAPASSPLTSFLSCISSPVVSVSYYNAALDAVKYICKEWSPISLLKLLCTDHLIATEMDPRLKRFFIESMLNGLSWTQATDQVQVTDLFTQACVLAVQRCCNSAASRVVMERYFVCLLQILDALCAKISKAAIHSYQQTPPLTPVQSVCWLLDDKNQLQMILLFADVRSSILQCGLASPVSLPNSIVSVLGFTKQTLLYLRSAAELIPIQTLKVLLHLPRDEKGIIVLLPRLLNVGGDCTPIQDAVLRAEQILHRYEKQVQIVSPLLLLLSVAVESLMKHPLLHSPADSSSASSSQHHSGGKLSSQQRHVMGFFKSVSSFPQQSLKACSAYDKQFTWVQSNSETFMKLHSYLTPKVSVLFKDLWQLQVSKSVQQLKVGPDWKTSRWLIDVICKPVSNTWIHDWSHKVKSPDKLLCSTLLRWYHAVQDPAYGDSWQATLSTELQQYLLADNALVNHILFRVELICRNHYRYELLKPVLSISEQLWSDQSRREERASTQMVPEVESQTGSLGLSVTDEYKNVAAMLLPLCASKDIEVGQYVSGVSSISAALTTYPLFVNPAPLFAHCLGLFIGSGFLTLVAKYKELRRDTDFNGWFMVVSDLDSATVEAATLEALKHVRLFFQPVLALRFPHKSVNAPDDLPSMPAIFNAFHELFCRAQKSKLVQVSVAAEETSLAGVVELVKVSHPAYHQMITSGRGENRETDRTHVQDIVARGVFTLTMTVPSSSPSGTDRFADLLNDPSESNVLNSFAAQACIRLTFLPLNGQPRPPWNYRQLVDLRDRLKLSLSAAPDSSEHEAQHQSKEFLERLKLMEALLVAEVTLYSLGGALPKGQLFPFSDSYSKMNATIKEKTLRVDTVKKEAAALCRKYPSLCYFSLRAVWEIVQLIRNGDGLKLLAPLKIISPSIQQLHAEHLLSLWKRDTDSQPTESQPLKLVERLGRLLHSSEWRNTLVYEPVAFPDVLLKSEKTESNVWLENSIQHFSCNLVERYQHVVRLYLHPLPIPKNTDVIQIQQQAPSLPHPDELLWCSQTTSLEQLRHFLLRCCLDHQLALEKRGARRYCVVGLDDLQYSKEEIDDVFKVLVSEAVGARQSSYRLAILHAVQTGKQPGRSIRSPLSSDWKDLNPLHNDSIQRLHRHLFRNKDVHQEEKSITCPQVIIYKCSIPGGGKTYSVNKWIEQSGLKPVRLSAHSDADCDRIVSLMYEHASNNAACAFHVDIGPQAGQKIDDLLFCILVVGSVSNNQHCRYSKRPSDTFVIEMPFLNDSDSRSRFPFLTGFGPAFVCTVDPLDALTDLVHANSHLNKIIQSDVPVLRKMTDRSWLALLLFRRAKFDPKQLDRNKIKATVDKLRNELFPVNPESHPLVSYLSYLSILEKQWQYLHLLRTDTDRHNNKRTPELHVMIRLLPTISCLALQSATWTDQDKLVLVYSSSTTLSMLSNGEELERLQNALSAPLRRKVVTSCERFDNFSFAGKDRAARYKVLCSFLNVDPDRCPLDPSYALTRDNCLKMIGLFLRSECGFPTVIEGHTGCGKTKLVTVLAKILNVELCLMDVHPGYSEDEIVDFVLKAKAKAADSSNKKVWVFFDEINTCDHVGLFKSIVTDRRVRGHTIPGNVYILAACNPYQKLDNDSATGGSTAPTTLSMRSSDSPRALQYQVVEMPPSLNGYIWQFGHLSSADELEYARQMTEAVATQICADLGSMSHQFPSWRVNAAILQGTNRRWLVTCFALLLSFSQQWAGLHARECESYERDPLSKTDERIKQTIRLGATSLRDIERCLKLWMLFFRHCAEHQLVSKGSVQESSLIPWENARLRDSIILSLAHVYYYRLPTPLLRNHYLNDLSASEEYKQLSQWPGVMPELKLVPPMLSASSSPELSAASKEILSILQKEQALYLRLLSLPKGVAPTRNLTEAVFLMLTCIMGRIPLIVIGEPGCSKTLAMACIRHTDHQTVDAELVNSLGFAPFQVRSFQCSNQTTPQALKQVFDSALDWQTKSKSSTKSVVFLDELGLAEASPTRPLKVLHSQLDQLAVSFVGLSNWGLDSAKLNRCVVHRCLPVDDATYTQTALQILNMNTNPHQSKELPDVLDKLTSVYSKLRKLPGLFTFYGPRDFYGIIQHLRLELSKLILDPEESLEAMKEAIPKAFLRNMGGVPRTQAFCDALHPYNQPTIIHHRHNSPLELIRQNVREGTSRGPPHKPATNPSHSLITPQRADLNVRAEIGSRHVLVLYEHCCATQLLMESGVISTDCVIIWGSRFRNDCQGENNLDANLPLIKLCLAEGRTLVLLNSESFQQPLYAVLNQQYVDVAGNLLCRLALGRENRLCRVHPAFRCIVCEKADQMRQKKLPQPFLNRFEKQCIDRVQALRYDEHSDLLQSLHQALFHHCSHHFRLPQLPVEGSLLSHSTAPTDCLQSFAGVWPGFVWETFASLILAEREVLVQNDSPEWQIHYLMSILFLAMTPETPLSLTINKRQQMASIVSHHQNLMCCGSVLTHYFHHQGHADLADLLSTVEGQLHIKQSPCHAAISHNILVQTFDESLPIASLLGRFAVHVSCSQLSLSPSFCLRLNEIDSVSQLLSVISEFFANDNSKTANKANVFLIQCPVGTEVEHIDHIQCCIEGLRRDHPTSSLKLVMLVVHCDRHNPATHHPLIFHRSWSRVYLDSLITPETFDLCLPRLSQAVINPKPDLETSFSAAALLQNVDLAQMVCMAYKRCLSELLFPRGTLRSLRHHAMESIDCMMQRIQNHTSPNNQALWRVTSERLLRTVGPTLSSSPWSSSYSLLTDVVLVRYEHQLLLDGLPSVADFSLPAGSLYQCLVKELFACVHKALLHLLAGLISQNTAAWVACVPDSVYEKAQESALLRLLDSSICRRVFPLPATLLQSEQPWAYVKLSYECQYPFSDAIWRLLEQHAADLPRALLSFTSSVTTCESHGLIVRMRKFGQLSSLLQLVCHCESNKDLEQIRFESRSQCIGFCKDAVVLNLDGLLNQSATALCSHLLLMAAHVVNRWCDSQRQIAATSATWPDHQASSLERLRVIHIYSVIQNLLSFFRDLSVVIVVLDAPWQELDVEEKQPSMFFNDDSTWSDSFADLCWITVHNLLEHLRQQQHTSNMLEFVSVMKHVSQHMSSLLGFCHSLCNGPDTEVVTRMQNNWRVLCWHRSVGECCQGQKQMTSQVWTNLLQVPMSGDWDVFAEQSITCLFKAGLSSKVCLQLLVYYLTGFAFPDESVNGCFSAGSVTTGEPLALLSIAIGLCTNMTEVDCLPIIQQQNHCLSRLLLSLSSHLSNEALLSSWDQLSLCRILVSDQPDSESALIKFFNLRSQSPSHSATDTMFPLCLILATQQRYLEAKQNEDLALWEASSEALDNTDWDATLSCNIKSISLQSLRGIAARRSLLQLLGQSVLRFVRQGEFDSLAKRLVQSPLLASTLQSRDYQTYLLKCLSRSVGWTAACKNLRTAYNSPLWSCFKTARLADLPSSSSFSYTEFNPFCWCHESVLTEDTYNQIRSCWTDKTPFPKPKSRTVSMVAEYSLLDVIIRSAQMSSSTPSSSSTSPGSKPSISVDVKHSIRSKLSQWKSMRDAEERGKNGSTALMNQWLDCLLNVELNSPPQWLAHLIYGPMTNVSDSHLSLLFIQHYFLCVILSRQVGCSPFWQLFDKPESFSHCCLVSMPDHQLEFLRTSRSDPELARWSCQCGATYLHPDTPDREHGTNTDCTGKDGQGCAFKHKRGNNMYSEAHHGQSKLPDDSVKPAYFHVKAACDLPLAVTCRSLRMQRLAGLVLRFFVDGTLMMSQCIHMKDNQIQQLMAASEMDTELAHGAAKNSSSESVFYSSWIKDAEAITELMGCESLTVNPNQICSLLLLVIAEFHKHSCREHGMDWASQSGRANWERWFTWTMFNPAWRKYHEQQADPFHPINHVMHAHVDNLSLHDAVLERCLPTSQKVSSLLVIPVQVSFAHFCCWYEQTHADRSEQSSLITTFSRHYRQLEGVQYLAVMMKWVNFMKQLHPLSATMSPAAPQAQDNQRNVAMAKRDLEERGIASADEVKRVWAGFKLGYSCLQRQLKQRVGSEEFKLFSHQPEAMEDLLNDDTQSLSSVMPSHHASGQTLCVMLAWLIQQQNAFLRDLLYVVHSRESESAKGEAIMQQRLTTSKQRPVSLASVQDKDMLHVNMVDLDSLCANAANQRLKYGETRVLSYEVDQITEFIQSTCLGDAAFLSEWSEDDGVMYAGDWSDAYLVRRLPHDQLTLDAASSVTIRHTLRDATIDQIHRWYLLMQQLASVIAATERRADVPMLLGEYCSDALGMPQANLPPFLATTKHLSNASECLPLQPLPLGLGCNLTGQHLRELLLILLQTLLARCRYDPETGAIPIIIGAKWRSPLREQQEDSCRRWLRSAGWSDSDYQTLLQFVHCVLVLQGCGPNGKFIQAAQPADLRERWQSMLDTSSVGMPPFNPQDISPQLLKKLNQWPCSVGTSCTVSLFTLLFDEVKVILQQREASRQMH